MDAARHDRLTVRLAELDAMADVLVRADDRLGEGWVQDAWVGGSGVCLVTAVRRESHGQLRARSLDTVWAALAGRPDAVRRVPPPQERLARVQDLARWNDRPGRTVADVRGLLVRAAEVVAGEVDRVRAELGTTAVSPARV